VALPLQKLGTTYPPRTTLIDPDRAGQHAAATNDPWLHIAIVHSPTSSRVTMS